MTNPDFLKMAYAIGAEHAWNQATGSMTEMEKQALLNRLLFSSASKMRKAIGGIDDAAGAAGGARMQTKTVADNAAEKNFFGAADDAVPNPSPDVPSSQGTAQQSGGTAQQSGGTAQQSGGTATPPAPAADPGYMDQMRGWMGRGNNGMYAAGGAALGAGAIGAGAGYAAAPDPTIGNTFRHYTGG